MGLLSNEIQRFANAPDQYVLRIKGNSIGSEKRGFSIFRFFSRLFFGEKSSYYLPAIFEKIINSSQGIHDFMSLRPDSLRVFAEKQNKFVTKHKLEGKEHEGIFKKISEMVKPFLSTTQPTSKELKMYLEYLVSGHISQAASIVEAADVLHPQQGSYLTWYEPLKDGQYSINFHGTDSLRHNRTTDKLCLIVNSQGTILSVQEDTIDTKTKSISEKWCQILHDIFYMHNFLEK